MASSSTPTPFLKSLNEKLGEESKESEYLDINPPVLTEQSSLEGINLLFDRFDYALHTFHYIKDDGNVKKSPVRTYTSRLQAHIDALKYNKDGYNVYFMVNEGDGIIHEGKKTARSGESVKEISKCFIDTDNCPIDKVNAYLASIRLKPHLVIESSPGRFHLYFFIASVEKSPVNILKWKAVQHILHRLGDETIKNPSTTLGMDKTMHDFSKVLRVPGFVHTSKLTTVNVVTSQDFPAYTLEELFELTEAQKFLDYNREQNGRDEPSNVPDLTDTSILSPGDRYAALQSLSLHLANASNYNDALGSYTLFIRHRLDNRDKIYCLPDGTLTQKSLDLFNSAFGKVERESRTITSPLYSVDDNSSDEEIVSPWTLPDDFYTSAPNGFGEVVQEVMNYSMYPCASLAFGTFLTGLSVIKSKTHLTPHGSSTALYTLNVAPTGYGKADPMTLLQNMFVANGLGRLISNEIRSDRGIYNHLSLNDGTGFFILDEIAPLLRAIQSKDAMSHHANIAKVFLSLYSSGALKGISFGKIASSNTKKGEQEIVLDNPMLSVLGYTVPHEFNSLFTADSVAQGLFQRFIPIVAEVKFVPMNPNCDKTHIINSELFRLHLEAPEITSDGEQISPLQAVSKPRTRMTYTASALKRFNEIELEYRYKLIKAARNEDESYMSGMYSRLAEQIERIATVLSPDEITLPTLEYAFSFVESRHRAIMAVAEGTVLKGKGGAAQMSENIIVRTVGKLCREFQCNIVFKRDIYQRCRRYFENTKQFDFMLNECVENGSLELVKNFKKDTKKARPGLGVKLGDVLS